LNGGHPPRVCAPERDLCRRRDGSAMGAARAVAAGAATGRPRTAYLRRVANAIFYLLQAG
jgi:hypothetical protein